MEMGRDDGGHMGGGGAEDGDRDEGREGAGAAGRGLPGPPGAVLGAAVQIGRLRAAPAAMQVPLRSAPALLLCALALLPPGCAPTRAPTRTLGRAPTRAPPRCPPLMLQLLRAPPAPLRAASAAAFSLSPHGE